MQQKKARMLFVAPAFMNYEKAICGCLSENYDMTYLDTEPLLQPVRKQYKELPIPVRAFMKVMQGIRTSTREKMLQRYLKQNSVLEEKFRQVFSGSYDVILAINGDGLPRELIAALRNEHPDARMILYLWDDYDLLFKTDHIGLFDKVFSFNLLDCQKNGYELLSMFTPPNRVIGKVEYQKQYDICMIGSATPERVALIKKLKALYDPKYKLFFYLYSKEGEFDIETQNVPLNFDEYMEAVANARCLLEIVRAHQKGPTTRVNDCKFVKTKVITTNECKENYTGNGSNTWFLDETMHIPEEFINAPYDENIEPGVTIEKWISILLKG